MNFFRPQGLLRAVILRPLRRPRYGFPPRLRQGKTFRLVDVSTDRETNGNRQPVERWAETGKRRGHYLQ